MGGPLVDEVRSAGANLDEGMVLKVDGRLYHGEDCIRMLALLSTPGGLFNRANAAVFRSRIRSRLLYPLLRAGRNAPCAYSSAARSARRLGLQKLPEYLWQRLPQLPPEVTGAV